MSFQKYANSYEIADKLRKFQQKEVVCSQNILVNKKGELEAGTLLLVEFARLSKSGEQKIKGKFSRDIHLSDFSPSDIEYQVSYIPYQGADYFYSWYVTEDKLYLAEGKDADKLRKRVWMENFLQNVLVWFVTFFLLGIIFFMLYQMFARLFFIK